MHITRKEAQFLKSELESLLTCIEHEKKYLRLVALHFYEKADAEDKDGTVHAFNELNETRNEIRKLRAKQKSYVGIQHKVKKFLSTPKSL